LLNAILYLNRTGCPWRSLPHDFPACEAVYAFWRRLVERDTLSKIKDTPRTAIHLQEEREAEPSVVIIHRQYVQTAEKRDGWV
jgi:transposase